MEKVTALSVESDFFEATQLVRRIAIVLLGPSGGEMRAPLECSHPQGIQQVNQENVGFLTVLLTIQFILWSSVLPGQRQGLLQG